MIVDWELIAKFGVPILTSLATAIVLRSLEYRARLIAYFSSVSSFLLPPVPQGPAQPPQVQAANAVVPAAPAPQRPIVHAHSIVIRNIGKKTAFNVRVGHFGVLQTFELNPPVKHDVTTDPNGGWEILIPTLVPDDQVQVSYLYSPPLTANLINSYIKSDETSAVVQNVRPMLALKPVAKFIIYCLFYLGVAAFTYLVIMASRWVYAVTLLTQH